MACNTLERKHTQHYIVTAIIDFADYASW
jgi:hypothetical protein